jgi:hypothetical protein
MMRWVRFAGGALLGTPVLAVTLVLMLGAWTSAAEIYAVVIPVPGHGELAAIVLMCLNVVCAWLLVFSLLGLVHDLQELRLPRHRQLLGLGVTLIFGSTLVAPCAFVWWLHGGARDAVMIGAGSVAGATGALLWRLLSRVRNTPVLRISALTVVSSVPAQCPNSWRAVRVALGPPYAPASWQRRGFELASLCAVVAAAPLLALFYEGSLQPRAFPYVLHAAQFVGFLAAVGLCWIWPLSRLVAIFNPERGALTELALLPGLGGGRQQLRRLCLVALGVPTVGVMLLLIGALMVVTRQHLPHVVYIQVAAQFLFIPLITLPILISQMAKPGRSAARSVAVLMLSQIWTFSTLIWSGMWDAHVPDSSPLHMFRRLAVGLVLTALVVVVGFSVHSWRKLTRRPHPFVEISS